MTAVRALWLRVPLLVRAVLTGLVAAMAGTVPWAILMSANTRHLSVLGLDASFWVSVVALLVVGAAAV